MIVLIYILLAIITIWFTIGFVKAIINMNKVNKAGMRYDRYDFFADVIMLDTLYKWVYGNNDFFDNDSYNFDDNDE